jgi:DNA-binding Xre family transcriptional regulator
MTRPMTKNNQNYEHCVGSALKERGISISEVSRSTGLSRETLHRIVRNKHHHTTTRTLQRISEFLGCRVRDLIR